MAKRLGLFGGSFNPIHFGHLIIARAILEQASLDEMIFLPSRRPPHKNTGDLADAAHRAAMVQRAIEGERTFAFHDFDLSREGPCYTIQTVAHFHDRFPQAELFWIVGADSLGDLPTWHQAGSLMSACTILTAARSGAGLTDWAALERAFGKEHADKLKAGVVATPVMDISSTDIRLRVSQGRSIRYLVPEPVRQYIASHHMYAHPKS